VRDKLSGYRPAGTPPAILTSLPIAPTTEPGRAKLSTTPQPPRLRVAVVGAGSMGALHARVLTQSQDTELSCIVDPDRIRGEELAARFATRWIPELDDFDDCDAVIVASPTPTHLEWGLCALKAERPTLIEKPLADDLGETSTIIDAARASGVPLMCGLLERFNPAVRTATGVIGDPVHVATVRHSPYVARITTGVAHDLLIHDVDLVLRIAGALPDRITASFGYCQPESEPGAEDLAEVRLGFGSRLLASLSVSRVSQRKVRTLVISELDRLVEVDLLRQDITVYRHVGNAPLDQNSLGYRQQTIIDIPAIVDAREPLASQLDRFVALARGTVDAGEELDSLLPPHRVVDDIARVAGDNNRS
jgi:predicted dehydrogenase